MQLTSPDQNTVIDYFPIKLPMGDISFKYLLQVVTNKGNTVSKEFPLRSNFESVINDYVDSGWTVTNFNEIPQLANPMLV